MNSGVLAVLALIGAGFGTMFFAFVRVRGLERRQVPATRDEIWSRGLPLVVGFGLAISGLSLVGVVAIRPGAGSGDTTAIDAAADIEDLLVDPEDFPEVFTGQLVDVEGDGTADVALFGAPEAPVIRPLVSENPGRDWGPWAAGGALILAAILGPVAAQWARYRWPSPAKDGESS